MNRTSKDMPEKTSLNVFIVSATAQTQRACMNKPRWYFARPSLMSYPPVHAKSVND